MDAEDFLEPEVGVAVAVTAVVCSPRLRKTLRKGLVYGLAAALTAGDAMAEAGRSVKTAAAGAAEKARGLTASHESDEGDAG